MTEAKVPFIDLKQRFQEEKKELLGCIEKVLESGHLVMTNELAEFEEEVAEYTDVKHCIGLNSGTDALMMGLMGAGVSKGDEVITSPISFVATTGAIAHVGARPIYVDVGPDQNIDPELVEAAITPNTKAIMPVHWAGRIADMKSLCEIADRHGLAMLEDSAQCMGAYLNGQHAGTFGLAGAISLHPLKNLNALGDGGLMLTDNDNIAKKVRLYRNHGLESRDSCVTYGINSRLDILNAEILKFRLKKLNGVIAARRRNASIYRELLKLEQVTIPDDLESQESAYVMFIVMCEERDRLQVYLKDKGIESLIYYGTPLHLHPAAKKFGYQTGDFPIAESQADRVLALPHHQYVTREQIEFVASSIIEFYLG